MKLMSITMALAFVAGTVGLAGAANAQDNGGQRSEQGMRHDGQGNDGQMRHDGGRGGDRHYQRNDRRHWGHRRQCRTVWRHHRRIRQCW